MPRLTEFHRLQPDVSVRLKAEFQPLDRKRMDEEDIDIAIRYDPDDYGHLQADALMDEYLLVVATPEYLAAHPKFRAGKSLDGVAFLHDASPGSARRSSSSGAPGCRRTSRAGSSIWTARSSAWPAWPSARR